MKVIDLVDAITKHGISDDDVVEVHGCGKADGFGQNPGVFAILCEEAVEIDPHSEFTLFASAFNVAGIEILAHWELPNQYWPKPYTKTRLANPWWLVKTRWGLIKIGRRKRVWAIDWSDCKFGTIVTPDDVTKTQWSVHAWTKPKLVEYLTDLGTFLETCE